uniref:Uncharacterized protein n=1 Tax=Pavo cristatus TaxID=9049 RepID=A0A8C9FTI6_PAVCR
DAPEPWAGRCQVSDVAEGWHWGKLNVLGILKSLKEKIDQLKDSLLRAVSAHQMYLHKSLALPCLGCGQGSASPDLQWQKEQSICKTLLILLKIYLMNPSLLL